MIESFQRARRKLAALLTPSTDAAHTMSRACRAGLVGLLAITAATLIGVGSTHAASLGCTAVIAHGFDASITAGGTRNITVANFAVGDAITFNVALAGAGTRLESRRRKQ